MTDAQLFRLLIQKPRPVLPIAYRIRGAEQFKLSVRGLKRIELAAAVDYDAAGMRMAGFVAAALMCDGAPAFASIDNVLALYEHELTPLATAVSVAAAIVSPMVGADNAEDLHLKLCAGAKASGNLPEAARMADCSEVVYSTTERFTTYRPERYYGIATSDLSDGQLMAFYAACKVVGDMRRTHERK